MTHEEFIAREGWPYILVSLGVAAVLYYAGFEKLSGIAVILAIFSTFFFRNPKRHPPNDQNLVLAPADGRVMEIQPVIEEDYLQDKAIKVSIFLNIFNVHVNRMPTAGQVEWIKKDGNSFLPAYKKEASLHNVRNYLGINGPAGKILVVQITGIIARRLVCWVNPGDNLQAGDRFGLIKFGSCTELYLPVGTNIKVVPGQKVKGGETVIGVIANQQRC